MTNKKTDIRAALKTVIPNVVFDRPKSFKRLPCISHYEINNSPYDMADDTEYLTEVNVMVDVWADTNDETDSLALRVDAALSGAGFIREMSRDVSDPGSIRHKTMRFQYVGG